MLQVASDATEDGGVRFVLVVRPDLIKYPACGSKNIVRKGRHFRELQTGRIGLKPVLLVPKIPKCQSAGCGKRFKVSRFPGVWL